MYINIKSTATSDVNVIKISYLYDTNTIHCENSFHSRLACEYIFQVIVTENKSENFRAQFNIWYPYELYRNYICVFKKMNENM